MRDLTKRQGEVLDFIRRYLAENDMVPTRSEIAENFGFSSANAAAQHLKALEKKGYIQLLSDIPRGIRLMANLEDDVLNASKESLEINQLPVIGRVAAGMPIWATENIEMYYKIDPDLFRPRADYFLRVQGHSMVKAGIHDGDLLAVQSNVNEVRDKEIVVARVDDEVTVKRYHQEDEHTVMLLPENDSYVPIRVDLREQGLHIEGRCVGVLRNSLPL